jgi:hypothetical protein
MSAAGWRICLYLQDGTRSSTLHAPATEPRTDVIQLATWLAHATLGTAVVEASGDGTRPIRVVRHPKATRPAETKAPVGGGPGQQS